MNFLLLLSAYSVVPIYAVDPVEAPIVKQAEQIAAVAPVVKPLPEPIDMFFSGGGIRATFGTLVAMCETRLYWDKQEVKTFTVDNIVGLSGGAWGVSILGSAEDHPCRLVEKVLILEKWGEISSFHPARCSNWDGPLTDSCFNGWVADIQKWFGEIFQGRKKAVIESKDKLEAGEDRDMTVPKGFSRQGFGGKHLTRVWIQTDPCHFGGKPARIAHGDGACIIGATTETIYCAGDIDNTKEFPERLETHVKTCEVGDEGTFGTTYTALTFNKLLAFSSAAWASATAVSNGAIAGVVATTLIAGGDKRTPEIKCTKEAMQSSFCDAGGECNLPLGALDVMYHEAATFGITPKKINQFITFDYSDNGGDQIMALRDCLNKWSAKKGWVLVANTPQSWGYTLLMKGAAPANDEFILHVVLFRGKDSGDNLVKEFPTIQTISPNFFVPKSAKKVADQYKGFLERDLFAADPSPFTRSAQQWKEALEEALPRKLGFQQKKSKKDLKRILQPVL